MTVGLALDPHESKLLAALLRSETALTGRALARITGLSQSTAQRALVRLRNAGLVVAEQAPPAMLYRTNPDHLAMPAISELLRLNEQLRARAADLLRRWQIRPASALIYGSVARGTATGDSDLDVLVVRPPRVRADDGQWQAQIAELGDALFRWTGRTPSVIELGATEAKRGIAAKEPYLLEADREGWLVAGSNLTALARVKK
jgi:predicted nucleotidyltransferase